MSSPGNDIKNGRAFGRPFFLVLSAVLATVILMSLPVFHVLQIRTPRTDKTIWTRMISPGDTFALGYRHSVELSMVWDFFLTDGEYRLVLYETRFDSSNAGLPSVINEGEKLILEPDVIRITNRKIVIPSLQLWVNRNSLNTLKMNSIRLSLPDLAGDQLIEIRLAKRSVLGYLWRKYDDLVKRPDAAFKLNPSPLH